MMVMMMVMDGWMDYPFLLLLLLSLSPSVAPLIALCCWFMLPLLTQTSEIREKGIV